MDPDAAVLTPEERLSQGLCCECGEPLGELDVTHHSLQHWVQWIRPDGTNAEAIRRQGLMSDYAAAHPPAARKATPSKPSGPATFQSPTKS